MCIQSWGRSSYARALIEVRADVELKDNIVAAMPKIVGVGFYTCNICVEYEWKPPSPSTTLIIEKINKLKKLINDGKVTLVDGEGKPLEKVESSRDYDSEDEVASVNNEMACYTKKIRDQEDPNTNTKYLITTNKETKIGEMKIQETRRN
uniref:Uncharacterized protein n=1 Tax=Tanacetum cinerariifolium TaxID=118510 RepID=A0A6L2NVN6_TANCI|nr:hypothetical protein [Tanacetum cinerariifolium]